MIDISNCIYIIDKEQGYTSHDVVAKMRGILGIRKIGHTGTLDPDATGVLPICVGMATKLCDMITDRNKTYHAVMMLGIETDTQDMTGTVIKKSPIISDEAEVRCAIMSFVGAYDQVPPMYSAIKIDGKKLVDLAREGKIVDRKPRKVYIDKIDIENIDLPLVTMNISCSKGTYIRTLCDDIGKKLGCGGAMKLLRRTKVGRFDISSAYKLSDIVRLRDDNRLSDIAISIDKVLSEYSRYDTCASYDKAIRNGNIINIELSDYKIGDIIRVYDSMGIFIGLFEYDGNKLKPIKIFWRQ